MPARPSLVMLAFLLVACAPEPRAAAAPNDSGVPLAAEPVASALEPAHSPDTAPTTATTATTPTTPAPGTVLVLAGDGLRVMTRPSGSTRPVDFGTGIEQAVEQLSYVIGSPPQERGTSTECGPVAYATWASGLTVRFVGARFAGWSVRNGSAAGRLTTAAGIGIGSTRAALDAAYTARVTRSSLGTEFSAGGLVGLLGSARPDARITELWAGEACVGR